MVFLGTLARHMNPQSPKVGVGWGRRGVVKAEGLWCV